MDYTNWLWPQWYFAICYVIAIILQIASNGKERKGVHNGALGVAMCVFGMFALYMGGFWA